MAEDGLKKKRKPGGFKTMPFILGKLDILSFASYWAYIQLPKPVVCQKFVQKNRKVTLITTNSFLIWAACDICDRFATTSFNANMITYLTKQIHMPMVQASNTITNFGGTSSMTPIIGGIMADSFAGRFWGITVGSILYLFGMITLTVSAVVPSLHPPPCAAHQQCHQASSGQLLILYASLLFTATGSGGIRSCVVPFGADQFELHGTQPAAKNGYISNIKYNYYYYIIY